MVRPPGTVTSVRWRQPVKLNCLTACSCRQPVGCANPESTFLRVARDPTGAARTKRPAEPPSTTRTAPKPASEADGAQVSRTNLAASGTPEDAPEPPDRRPRRGCILPFGRLGRAIIMGAMPQLSTFLDTNTFLHFPKLDQIDWPALLGSADVRLIVAPVVIRELNRHKDFPTSSKTRERAAAALRALNEWSERPMPVVIRKSVELQFRVQDPLVDFAGFNLSRDVADDHLVASILEYNIEAGSGAARLVTADLGLKLKAKSHGIYVDQLPPGLRLPDDLLPEEKKRSELESEVRRLRDRLPKLKLLFNSNEPHLRVQRSAFARPKSEVLTDVDLRTEYPKVEASRAALPRASAQSLESLHRIPAEDVRKYNDQLELFYAAHAEYVAKLNRFDELRATTLRLDISAVNEGTCPAQDLDVFLHFPDGFALVSESNKPKKPRTPDPPDRPRTLAETLASGFQIPDILARSPPINFPDIPGPSNVGKPLIRRTRSYDVEVSIVMLKHGFVQPLEPFYAIFESSQCIRSFTIDYSIHASNLPDPAQGQLHVIVDGVQ